MPLCQVAELGRKIDALYAGAFAGMQLPRPAEGEEGAEAAAALAAELAAALPDPSSLTEAAFGELGRTSPKAGALPAACSSAQLVAASCTCPLLLPSSAACAS